MAELKINGQELRDKASKMRSRVENMASNLNKVTSAVTKSEDAFQSQAGTKFRSQYGELKGKFEEFKKATNSYADFLDRTAQTYDEVDKKLEEKANSLQI